MAIVGGALLTPWMADIIGDANSVWCQLVPMFSGEWDTNLKLTQASLRASFIVPAICFAVVLLYAILFAKRRKGYEADSQRMSRTRISTCGSPKFEISRLNSTSFKLDAPARSESASSP